MASEKKHSPTSLRFAIVVSKWNEKITEGLLKGALETFQKQEISAENIDIFHVPGALEIPLVTKKLAQSQNYQALLALGCVIKGETYHFEIVANESCRHLTSLALEFDIPILLGILTTYTREEALARSGENTRNKGRECAESALKMLHLFQEMEF
jgi:6,7-dimethyl-8-ribityllumazine synthase